MTRGAFLLLVLLIVAHVVLAAASARQASAVFDEPDYLATGRYLIEVGDWRFSSANFHPPFVFHWNSLFLLSESFPADVWQPPRHADGRVWYDVDIGNRLLERSNNPMDLLWKARLPTLILSVLLLGIVYAWAHDLYGRRGAAVTGFLYAFCPTLIAHARLATTDMALAIFVVGHFFVWRRFHEELRPGWALVCGLLAGASMAAKLNGIFVPVVGLALLAWSGRRRGWGTVMRATLLYGVTAVFVLAALYGFSFGPLREPGMQGRVAAAILGRMPGSLGQFLSGYLDLSVPLPEYLRLWATTIAFNQRGIPGFLLGEMRSTGWWYYFPVAWFVKTPLPAIALSLAGLWNLARRRLPPESALPLAAALLLTWVPAIGTSINIGIRHILPAYPLFYVAAGSVGPRVRGPLVVGLLLAMGIWQLVSVTANHPHHLSYFNEAAGGIEGGERWLSDSNLDWGEDYVRLARWQRDNAVDTLLLVPMVPYDPAIFGVRHKPWDGVESGLVAVEVMRLQFARATVPNPYAALDARIPMARIGASIRIYDVRDSGSGRS